MSCKLKYEGDLTGSKQMVKKDIVEKKQDGRRMDKRIRQFSSEIQNGRLLEQNIPQLYNFMADDYEQLAKVRLALHYFTLYEAYYDDENTWSQEAHAIIARVNQVIQDNIRKSSSGEIREDAVKEIDNIRKEVMKRMNSLTIYADLFQIYEYVLNRIEYRFKEEIKEIDEIEFAKEILRYIFESEDNLCINEKIKDIIGQLPVRITKQKYFEIINDSLGAYLGSDSSSLDTFLYMLRTSATLYTEEYMETMYPVLWEKKEYLSHLDFKELSEPDYKKAVSMLQGAFLTLETETSVYFSVQEIINEAYVLLLCQPYSGMVVRDVNGAQKASDSIIAKINQIFICKEKKELEEEFLEQFANLEGIQEELSYEIELMENAMYEIGQNHKSLVQSLMLNQYMQVLLRAQSLLSNSLFIELESSKEDVMVDEVRILKEAEALEKELKDLFDSCDRMVSRAVMANTLNKVPVFFNDHKEVMDYVRYSLERCSDIYEKAACVDIINEIMCE